MRRLACVCVLAGLAFGLAPATAPAQSGSRQSAELRFVEQRPGVPSALTLSIDYVNPDDPGAKPPAVRTVVEELAPGARIDTSVPELCTASDAELMLLGSSACPPRSRVGSGTIRIDTGLPEPERFIDADVTFLNNTDELIFVSTERGSGARVVSRSDVQDRRIVNSAPPLPGTPPDGGAIDVVEARLDEISRQIDGVRRGYVTTPGECPLRRAWTNSVRFTYADGVSQTVQTQSRCSRSRAPNCRRAEATVLGTPRADELRGTSERDIIVARGGADRIRSGGGNDLICGGRGADHILGMSGSDRVYGDRGSDRVVAGRGADVARGGQGADVLRGGPGRDRVHGGRGNDRLFGGPGRDLVRGGPGNDRIDIRGGGVDTVRCGLGRDVAIVGPKDQVYRSCEVVRRG